MERAYTVKEIDELRLAIRQWLDEGFRWLRAKPGESYSYYMSSDSKVEEYVRTHMLAGHVADDIYEAHGIKKVNGVLTLIEK